LRLQLLVVAVLVLCLLLLLAHWLSSILTLSQRECRATWHCSG
jgi:hypothetical protein